MIETRGQIEIDFTVGITEAYPTLMDVVRAACDPSTSGRQRKAVAADLDVSPSELSRSIGEAGDRPLKVDDLSRLLDVIPKSRHLVIEWLIEKYLDSATTRAKRAEDVILQLAPPLLDALAVINRTRGLGDGRQSE